MTPKKAPSKERSGCMEAACRSGSADTTVDDKASMSNGG